MESGGFCQGRGWAWSPSRDWAGEGQEWLGALCPWGLAVLPSLVLVPLHTTPKAVETELNALYDVFLDASERWQTKVGLGRFCGKEEGQGSQAAGPDSCLHLQDVILLGDFNADCASLTKKRLDDLVLRTQAGFHWAIADGVDTTVRASTHCTYDRIVLHGEHLQSLLRGAAAFNFPQSFGLTEQEVKQW